MLHFQINPHSGVPVYRQLMDQIKYYIASKTLKVGQQLPSIRELSRKLTINPTTVVKAYSELEHDGVIEMKHGKGAFVSALATRMSKKQLENAIRHLAGQLVVEASQMNAPPELVMRLVKEEFKKINTRRKNKLEGRSL